MPITADILAQLKKLQGQPTTSEAPSPFLKVPNSDLMSRVTRGADTPTPNLSVPPQPDAGAVSDIAGNYERSLPPFDATMRPGQTKLDVLRDPSTSPRSRVYQTPEGVREDAPTPMGHGFWNRLKKVGEGAVIGMGQIAKQNAQSGREQTLESLLGGGAAGGVVGGVNPLSIDVLRRQNEIGQAENDQFRQGELQNQQAQIQAAKQKPLLDVQRLILEQQRADEAAKRADETNAIRRDANDIQRNRQPAQRQPIFKTKKRSDGSEVMMRSDDNGANFKEVPELGSEAPAAKPTKETGLTPYQQTERKAKAAALAGKIDGARRDAEAAINLATRIGDDPTNAGEKDKAITAYQKALADGNAAATELNTAYGDLYEAGAGTSDAAGSNTQGVQWPYYKPKARLGGASGGVAGSDPRVKQYADKFFGGDIKKAQSAIAKQRGQ